MQPPGRAPDDAEPPVVPPLDAADPRFGPASSAHEHQRRLVRTMGPGPSPLHPRVRILRAAIPLLFLAGVVLVGAVFVAALRPADAELRLGTEAAVRAAVAERPRRVCLGGQLPCAWIVLVDGRLLALNTSGPLREEFGRQGIGWCPSSGYFGSDVLGTRYDPAGRVVRGPSPRGLDRFELRVEPRGQVVVDFRAVTAGLQAYRTHDVIPPTGSDCEPMPFDRDPDLRLP